MTVHPRVCGEHGFSRECYDGQYGSSPRVRGTPLAGSLVGMSSRFIPACAGNTDLRPDVFYEMAVHPRVCGEHLLVVDQRVDRPGSSPRVRGTRLGEVLMPLPVRFIPACAGNTPTDSPRPRAMPVHPRVCGEHAPGPAMVSTVIRFIPACAGNTSSHQRQP